MEREGGPAPRLVPGGGAYRPWKEGFCPWKVGQSMVGLEMALGWMGLWQSLSGGVTGSLGLDCVA